MSMLLQLQDDKICGPKKRTLIIPVERLRDCEIAKEGGQSGCPSHWRWKTITENGHYPPKRGTLIRQDRKGRKVIFSGIVVQGNGDFESKASMGLEPSSCLLSCPPQAC